MADRLLEVRDLQTSFRMRDGVVRAVDGATFGVDRGEVLGLVGESGCGKSVTSLSILRLITPPGQITGGSIHFDGKDLLTASEAEMQKIRGNRIAMIFQQPNSSLNPVQRLADQIGEVLRIHKGLDAKAARMRGIELLELVGIPDPGRRADAYPHEISGGMAQRVMIAMALACEPELLIADEPTTALDVTIQAQILELLRDLRERLGTAIVLITHDLGVVSEFCDRVAVMYAGEVVEEQGRDAIFDNPRHPYTQGLLGAIPRAGTEPIVGCRFGDRCGQREATGLAACTSQHPDLLAHSGASGSCVRCHLYDPAHGALALKGAK
jgi:ABC-type dipeptide/oligopeptide/nickel transport system ATPase component